LDTKWSVAHLHLENNRKIWPIPRNSLCKHLIGREFFGKQLIRTSSNHYLAEKFFLVGEMTVDRLHGNARGFGDPVHRRSRERVSEKVLPRSKHNRAILLGDHGRFGSLIHRLRHLCLSPFFTNRRISLNLQPPFPNPVKRALYY
jgi:hypothetical protein